MIDGVKHLCFSDVVTLEILFGKCMMAGIDVRFSAKCHKVMCLFIIIIHKLMKIISVCITIGMAGIYYKVNESNY